MTEREFNDLEELEKWEKTLRDKLGKVHPEKMEHRELTFTDPDAWPDVAEDFLEAVVEDAEPLRRGGGARGEQRRGEKAQRLEVVENSLARFPRLDAEGWMSWPQKTQRQLVEGIRRDLAERDLLVEDKTIRAYVLETLRKAKTSV